MRHAGPRQLSLSTAGYSGATTASRTRLAGYVMGSCGEGRFEFNPGLNRTCV